jgi:hypothetical protein
MPERSITDNLVLHLVVSETRLLAGLVAFANLRTVFVAVEYMISLLNKSHRPVDKPPRPRQRLHRLCFLKLCWTEAERPIWKIAF